MSAPSIEEGNARLLHLADFLEKLPPERFEYNKWVGDDWGGKQDLSCGTTACALGWACTMPEFQELGLRMSKAGIPIMDVGASMFGTSSAANGIFALDYEGYDHLFVPMSLEEETATPKQVVAKIRAYVSSGRKLPDYDLPNEDD